MADESTAVIVWWVTLAALSVGNIVAWAVVAWGVRREMATADGGTRRFRRLQVILSGLFTFGCAYRSFLPRVEGERFCLYGSWVSSVFIARAVATVAELAMVAQWALLLSRWAREQRVAWVLFIARLLVPLIVFAEICSWYTTLTTDYFGAVIEESTWAAAATLLTVSLVGLFPQTSGVRRTFAGVAIVFNAAYVVFMCTVDVPMYALRWRRGQAEGGHYLTLDEGLHDSLTRWIVTRRLADWREEIAWMTLYFVVGVWISIALIRAPLGDHPPHVGAQVQITEAAGSRVSDF